MATQNNPQTKTTQPVEATAVVEVTKAAPAPVEVMSLREQKLQEMGDTSSPLRNQEGVQNTVDFQLLSNTPAEMIIAMSGWSLDKLADRAKELETTLKGSLAGSMNKVS